MFTGDIVVKKVPIVDNQINNMDYHDIRSIEYKIDSMEQISKYVYLRAKFLVKFGREVRLASEAAMGTFGLGKQVAGIMESTQKNYNKYLNGVPVIAAPISKVASGNNHTSVGIANTATSSNSGTARKNIPRGSIMPKSGTNGSRRCFEGDLRLRIPNPPKNGRRTLITDKRNHIGGHNTEATSSVRYKGKTPSSGVKRCIPSTNVDNSKDTQLNKGVPATKRIKYNADYPKPWRVPPPLLPPRDPRKNNASSKKLSDISIVSSVKRVSLNPNHTAMNFRQQRRDEPTQANKSNIPVNVRQPPHLTGVSNSRAQSSNERVQLRHSITSTLQAPRKSFVAPNPYIAPGRPLAATKRPSLIPQRSSTVFQRLSANPNRSSALPRRMSITPSAQHRAFGPEKSQHNAKNTNQLSQKRTPYQRKDQTSTNSARINYQKTAVSQKGPFSDRGVDAQHTKLPGPTQYVETKKVGEIQTKTNKGNVSQDASNINITTNISRRYSLGADPEMLRKKETISFKAETSRHACAYTSRLSLGPNISNRPSSSTPNPLSMPRRSSLKPQHRLSLPTKAQKSIVEIKQTPVLGEGRRPRVSLQFGGLKTITEQDPTRR